MVSRIVRSCYPHGLGLIQGVLDYVFKGTLSRRFVCFGMKNVLKFNLNAFSCVQNTPRTSRESNDFLKGRTNHSQFLAIFSRNEGKT